MEILLQSLVTGGVVLALIALIYNNLQDKINSKVSKEMCEEARKSEDKQYEHLRDDIKELRRYMQRQFENLNGGDSD